MAEEDDIELAVEAPKSSKKKIVVIVLAGLLVAGGGTAGALYFMGVFPTGASAAVSEAGEEAQPEAEPEDVELKEAFYVSLDPPFTVNFNGGGGSRYLQVTMNAMTREEAMQQEITRHMPVIRNDLMMIMSSKASSELSSREGKESLRAEALAAIKVILERETGSPGVEALYFTSFVMQ